MEANSSPESQAHTHTQRPSNTLTDVLTQAQHIRDLVEEYAEELSSINGMLQQELAKQNLPPTFENALAKGTAAENKAHQASDELSELSRALEAEVRDRNLVDLRLAAVTEQEEGARHVALHDPLTGLPNRALFNDRLEHGLMQAGRHGRSLAVLFIDLDDFKKINDSYGHAAGDDVLRTMTTRLTDMTRGDDTVSRFGGDEFLYLLMEVRHEADIALIAKKIIQAIRAPCNVRSGERYVSQSVNASIGISIFPRDGTTADTLIKSADKAMYWAKENKSGYSLARPATTTERTRAPSSATSRNETPAVETDRDARDNNSRHMSESAHTHR